VKDKLLGRFLWDEQCTVYEIVPEYTINLPNTNTPAIAYFYPWTSHGTSGLETDFLVCDCPNLGDPAMNGPIVNVFDIVQAVNVAFRAGSPTHDLQCFARTDVDCSGITNVFDVYRFVEVAFRGGNKDLLFCSPCE